MVNDIEKILDDIRENSNVLANYHRKRYLTLKSRLKYYRIPIIVISALNSVGAVSLQGFIGQTYISLINMALSLIVGIVGSIEMFYNISKQIEIELSGSKDFYILGADIYKYLSLTRTNRNHEPIIFLNDSYSRYIKLIEVSLTLKKRVEDKLCKIPVLTTIATSPSQDVFIDTSSEDSNVI